MKFRLKEKDPFYDFNIQVKHQVTQIDGQKSFPNNPVRLHQIYNLNTLYFNHTNFII